MRTVSPLPEPCPQCGGVLLPHTMPEWWIAKGRKPHTVICIGTCGVTGPMCSTEDEARQEFFSRHGEWVVA